MHPNTENGPKSAGERLREELKFQIALACVLYRTENPEEAMQKWTDQPDSPDTPSKKFRDYLEAARKEGNDLDLSERDPGKLASVLSAAGIRTLH